MNRLGENETGFKYMKLTSDFGIGMLLGTSCMLVIPEGVDKFANASRSFGFSLLLGFLVMYGLDRFVQQLRQRNIIQQWLGSSQNTRNSVETFVDLFNPKKTTPLILDNNIVFALVIHGLSDGMALGVAQSYDSLKIIILFAIIIHKIPATLSLTGLMISKQGLSRFEVISNLIAFSLSSPIGLLLVTLVGIINHNFLKAISDNLLVISGSSLLYASLMALTASGDQKHSKDTNQAVQEISHTNNELFLDEENNFVMEEDEKLEELPNIMLILLGISIPLLISIVLPEED